MVVYSSSYIYIKSACDIHEKIVRLDAIIAALEDAVLQAAANGTVSEYSLDDGQTKISEVYRSPKDVAAAINSFEFIRQRYINQLNGRVIRLVDSKNLTGRRNER